MKKRHTRRPLSQDQRTRIGQRIRSLMAARDINQTELARATGIDLSSINQIVNGKRGADIGTLLDIATTLNVKPGELLDGLGRPDPKPKAPDLAEALIAAIQNWQHGAR